MGTWQPCLVQTSWIMFNPTWFVCSGYFWSQWCHAAGAAMKRPAAAKASAAGTSKWCLLRRGIGFLFFESHRRRSLLNLKSHLAQRRTWAIWGQGTFVHMQAWICRCLTSCATELLSEASKRTSPTVLKKFTMATCLCCNWTFWTMGNYCRMLPFWRGWQHCCNIGLSAAGFTGPLET